MLAHEQFAAPDLTKIGAAAAQAGFSLLATRPFPAVAGERSTCRTSQGDARRAGRQSRASLDRHNRHLPTLRYHPTVVAEAFATLAQLYPGRVFLGLGSGEALASSANCRVYSNIPQCGIGILNQSRI